MGAREEKIVMRQAFRASAKEKPFGPGSWPPPVPPTAPTPWTPNFDFTTHR